MKPAILLIIFFAILLHEARAQKAEVAIEKFARFTDGTEKFFEYIKKKVTYPEDAKKDSLTGVVYVEFVVDVDGTIVPESVKVLQGLSPSCDAAAVEVIKGAPKWAPASTKTASKVRQSVSFPVSFTFQ